MRTVLTGTTGPLFRQLSETAPESVISVPLDLGDLQLMVDGINHILSLDDADNIVFLMGNLVAIITLFKHVNPIRFFSRFKNVTMIFADGSKPVWVKPCKELTKLAHKVVMVDCYNDELGGKVIPGLYLPIKRIDWYTNQQKDINLAFYGSTKMYYDRREILNFLVGCGYKIKYGGGMESNYKLDMMECLRRTSITFNFSNCETHPNMPKRHQIKGRIWEAAVSKAVILETRNNETASIFNDDEIVFYDDMRELPALIDRLQHDYVWRESLADKAYAKAIKYVDPDKYWEKLLANV